MFPKTTFFKSLRQDPKTIAIEVDDLHLDRHSRSLLYYALSGADVAKVQNRISQTKIAILGCGVIGNLVAVLLATAGIEDFVLVDGDCVEISNLNRQIMFNESDQGQSKANRLAVALRERNSQVKTRIVSEFIDGHNVNDLKECDFIVLSGDSSNIVSLINKFLIKEDIPFLWCCFQSVFP